MTSSSNPGAANPKIIIPADQTMDGDYMVCMFDGARRVLLPRYVEATYGMTWPQYIEYCGLPADYPTTSDQYRMSKKDVMLNGVPPTF